jgi:hypothetical protein
MTETLVKLLRQASDNYYNGAVLLLDNLSYDSLIKILKTLDPQHPFLKTIGSPPLKSLCLLPGLMPLKRISPYSSYPPILYENYDGLTALWCPTTKSLYLRGDERRGQSIRSIVPHIQGLIHNQLNDWIIRGTLVLRKKFERSRHLARGMINQLINNIDIDPAILSNIWFIPYQVISPGRMTPQEQLEWLTQQGFRVPWWKQVTKGESISLSYLRRRIRNTFHITSLTILPPIT